MITPATPKNRHSSEKLNSFPPAMKYAASVIKLLIREAGGLSRHCRLRAEPPPNFKQEQLKYNPRAAERSPVFSAQAHTAKWVFRHY